MAQELMAYRWRCPICGERSRGLTDSTDPLVEGRVTSGLLNHVRATSDGGHGAYRTYPSPFDPEDAVEFVEMSTMDLNSTGDAADSE